MKRAAKGARVLTCLYAAGYRSEWGGSKIRGIDVCEPLTKVLLRYLNLSVNLITDIIYNKKRLIDVFTQSIIHCVVQHVNLRGIYTVGLNVN